MTNLRVIRICLMLAGIFAAGVVTGRFTTPQAEPILIVGRGRAQTPTSLTAELSGRVGLDEEQQRSVKPILRKMVLEMQRHPPLTQPRLDIFLRTMDSVRPLIRASQLSAFDRFIREQSERQRRGIQMNSRDE